MSDTMTTIMSFRQFADANRTAVRVAYGISVAESVELYPDGYLRELWWTYALREFNEGADFRTSVARGLDRHQLRALFRTTRGLRNGLPSRYLR